MTDERSVRQKSRKELLVLAYADDFWMSGPRGVPFHVDADAAPGIRIEQLTQRRNVPGPVPFHSFLRISYGDDTFLDTEYLQWTMTCETAR